MAWAGLDQRQFPRVNVRCDVLIHNRFGGTLEVQTQNLGVGGVCVLLKQELEKLSSVRLRLVLKKENPAIECEGRVVWTVRSKDPATGKVTYDTGIEFVKLENADYERIVNFIQQQPW